MLNTFLSSFIYVHGYLDNVLGFLLLWMLLISRGIVVYGFCDLCIEKHKKLKACNVEILDREREREWWTVKTTHSNQKRHQSYRFVSFLVIIFVAHNLYAKSRLVHVYLNAFEFGPWYTKLCQFSDRKFVKLTCDR